MKIFFFVLLAFFLCHSLTFASSLTWPKANNPYQTDQYPEYEKRIQELVEQMTLEQKVGQMTQVELNSITPQEVRDFHIGSIFVSGGGLLNKNRKATMEQWVHTADQYWKASITAVKNLPAIPISFAVDAVHGHNKLFGQVIYPHNIGLGASQNTQLVHDIAKATAEAMLDSGMDQTFAPSLSVTQNILWGRTYESYSQDPELVSLLGKSAVLGYQGSIHTPLGNGRVAATAKHFLGDGGTEAGIDRGENTSTEEELMAIHGKPYIAAIEAGVLWIMASHNSWQGQRLHGHQYLLTTILKNQLGFVGAITGDWNSHAQINGCTKTHCPEAINAGMDMLMVPYGWQDFIHNTVEDVKQGRISESRINDAVSRILRAKFYSGLMEAPKPSKRFSTGVSQSEIQQNNKALARKAVRESLVLLKHDKETLPIHPEKKILVVGELANNIGAQTGGWTLGWQGDDLTNADFPHGTSILKAIQSEAKNVEYSTHGSFHSQPDIAIVVYGERPYAEWLGDRRHLAFELESSHHAKILEQLQAKGIPTVSILLSGRPLWLNRELNASNAFIAAWLPGTEASGISDLLIATPQGQPRYNFTGKLPFDWPQAPVQSKPEAQAHNVSSLFNFGYGLNYSSTAKDWKTLPTDTLLKDIESIFNVDILTDKISSPWILRASENKKNDVQLVNNRIQLDSLTADLKSNNSQAKLQVHWHGTQKAKIHLDNLNAYTNYQDIFLHDGAIVIEGKILGPANKKVLFEMGCRGVEYCNRFADINVSKVFKKRKKNEHFSLSVSLHCFEKNKIDTRHIGRAFGLETSGKLSLEITDIRVQSQPKSVDFTCR